MYLMRKVLSQFPVGLRCVWVALSLALVATLALVACGGTATTPPQPSPTAAQPSPTMAPTATSQPSGTVVNVKIVEKNEKYMFDPATLTVNKGTQVVWTNMSDAPHTVTSDNATFNTSSNLSENQTFMFTFNTAGTFTYHCNIHPYMKATIMVTS
jgi:plastocyanin